MTADRPRNLPASVHDRLLALARESHRPFNELLQYFAMERFLFRMGRSKHAARFVLKGGLMLLAWRAPLSRPTKDIDMLASLDNDVQLVEDVVKDVCLVAVEPDGMTFDPVSVSGRVIVEQAEYPGVRVRLLGFLGSARVTLQLDVGFGDLVVPGPTGLDYPTLLADFPAPAIVGYSRESVIAEKFHAMVRLGRLNSRMNDFFDLWLLARQFDFEGQVLRRHLDNLRTSTHRCSDRASGFRDGFSDLPWEGGAMAQLSQEKQHRGCTERLRRRDHVHPYVPRADHDRAGSGEPV